MVKNSKAFKISILALFIAFIFIQTYVPLFGYIPIGPLNLTTVHITVVIAAIILGPTYGGVVGGTWGILSWIKAIAAPSSPVQALIFKNPIISIFPRILTGVIIGLIFLGFTKTKLNQKLAFIISGFLGAFFNTVIVLGLIYLFYQNPSAAQAYGVANPDLIGKALLAIIGTNGIPEAILSAIVTPIIATPLFRFTHQKND